MKKDLYKKLGVSSTKTEVHKAVRRLDKGVFPGAFCKLFKHPAQAGVCQLLHSDTAGTKAALACLMYMITGEVKYLAGIPLDAFVMNMNDGGCVGAVDDLMVTQTICRNSFILKADGLEAMIESGRQHCKMLGKLGISVVYASGETADTPDLNRTVDVGSSLYAEIPEHEVIDASNMKPGDIIVGFVSTGKAVWEPEENFGGGANGFTAMRHGMLHRHYRKYRETYAPELLKKEKDECEKLVYRGKHLLTDRLPGRPNVTIGEALLSPTRNYLPLIKLLKEQIGLREITGIIHCSGGGATKMNKFGASSNRYIKGGDAGELPPTPPLFEALQKSSRMSWEEMYRTVNMGWMLEIAFRSMEAAEAAIIFSKKKCGIDAMVIGRIERGRGKKREVVIVSPYGTFSYPEK